MRFLVTQGAADHWFAGPAVSAAGHVVVGYGSGVHAYDAQPATAQLARTLQHGIDVGMADFPLKPDPGAWWMPAALGGGAPTEEERRRLDAADGPRRPGAHRRQAPSRK
jgi:hypothetical protein